ncbi:DUF397 domain-containing protein [Streptomyces sp. NPDC049577]|uniref:DUF397 domain-containing protein n=1 Tax=Streptomyces sp. NPDC049577 TaxID=3155153 RepID=UPI00343A86A0
MNADLSAIAWRKSSYSDGHGGSCVEVCDALPGAIRVRDSKAPVGPVLALVPASWARFVSAVKAATLLTVPSR